MIWLPSVREVRGSAPAVAALLSLRSIAPSPEGRSTLDRKHEKITGAPVVTYALGQFSVNTRFVVYVGGSVSPLLVGACAGVSAAGSAVDV